MKPLVSIIIPSYNHAIYLKKALKSIIDQSYNNWEAIIIDNHSDDNTDLLLHSINDKRIKIYKIHNNGIIAASRNLGIKHSTGSFLAFLDSDDWWYDKKLEKCINQINNGSNYICHAEHWVKNRKIIRTVTYGPTGKANYYNLLYGKNCISTSAIIIRKEYVINVGGFIEHPSARGVEDYHLWLKLAKHGYQPDFIDQVLGCYRIYDFNYSSNLYRQLKSEEWVLKDHFNYDNNLGIFYSILRIIRLTRLFIKMGLYRIIKILA